MTDPFFFGYGSLVNRATHAYRDAHPARLKGWRRAWRHTTLREVAFLTAVPSAQDEIDGLIAHVPGNDWAALDEREYAYKRHPATDQITHALTRPLEVQVYAVPANEHGHPSVKHPILLSYLDVVVQGYLREFGLDGVRHFFQTTDGWDAPILNDRAAPRYPRHQKLNLQEQDLIDSHLKELGAEVRG
jgi:hypothetical protein